MHAGQVRYSRLQQMCLACTGFEVFFWEKTLATELVRCSPQDSKKTFQEYKAIQDQRVRSV